MNRLSSRLVTAVAVLVAALVASLIGGVGASRATTSFVWVFQPYVTSDTGNTVPNVTYGGAMGFHLEVQNTDTSNASHVQVVVKADSGATFLDASDPGCAAAKGDTSTMVCTPFGGTMTAGATYKLDFRFTAPSATVTVTLSPSVSISAQSVGGKNHGTNGTTIDPGPTTTTNVVPGGGDTTSTFLRHNESVETDGPQTFTFGLPSGLLGNPFALAVGVHNQTGTICGTCLPKYTTLTIPTATTYNQSGNPFYDGTNVNAYPWTMFATYPQGFTLHGVWHQPDSGGGTAEFIPPCSTLTNGVPTTDHPVCWLTLVQNKSKKTLTATGLGIENGNGGFG
jgi:hypothetical protein